MVLGARLAGAKTVVWTDTEQARTANRITFPFASRILTPDVYPDDLGPRHTRYHGLHELAYLSPSRFKPDASVLARYGLSEDRPYCVVRLIAWDAGHDLGVSHATVKEHAQVLEKLEERWQVVMIQEGEPVPALDRWTATIRPADFHQLLYHADLCVTEGATTASEAIVLGARTVYTNPVRRSYLDALEETGLLQQAPAGKGLTEAISRVLTRFPDHALARNVAADIAAGHEDVTERIVTSVLDAAQDPVTT